MQAMSGKTLAGFNWTKKNTSSVNALIISGFLIESSWLYQQGTNKTLNVVCSHSRKRYIDQAAVD